MGDKEQSVDGERMQRGSSLDFIVRGSRNVDGIEARFTVINGGRRLKAIMDSKLPSEGGRVKRGIHGCVYGVGFKSSVKGGGSNGGRFLH